MTGRHHPLALYVQRALMLLWLVAPIWVIAGALQIPKEFTNGTVANADEVNANFSAISVAVNDNDVRLTARKHPMGIYPNRGCRTGYTFQKLSSSGLGLCARLFDAAARQRTPFHNMQDCVDDGGRGATTFELLSMMHNDLTTFKTMAGHTTNVWLSYANGMTLMGTVGAGESGPIGTQINTFFPCVNTSGGSCFQGNTDWDHWDRTVDTNATGRLICVLGPEN